METATTTRDTAAAQYAPPVARLLELGEIASETTSAWRDYRALGLGPEHITELIRLACDAELHTSDSDSARVWAPVHAWRALGQLGAETAPGPLLALANQPAHHDDDWLLDDLPGVLGRIGPGALETATAFLAEKANYLYARLAAAHGLVNIAELHGEQHGGLRDEAIRRLVGQLNVTGVENADLAGHLVTFLLELEATEAAGAIERAYARGAVDEGVCGTWEDVRRELGVAGLGLVTAESPRCPNSLRDMMARWRNAGLGGAGLNGPRPFAQIVRDGRRERRKRRRRRR